MKTARMILGGLAALAALGLIGGITNGAPLWLIVPAVMLEALTAILITPRWVK